MFMKSSRIPGRLWSSLGQVTAAILLAVSLTAFGSNKEAAAAAEQPLPLAAAQVQVPAGLDLDGITSWLNTDKPLTPQDLRGRVVLIDFWTLCCINCMHILPDLARLEAKYPGVLVVIGNHTPKFPHEKEDASVRKAILRYGIEHPVANDSTGAMWRRYDVKYWPTFVVFAPDGRYIGKVNGEGLYQQLDSVIGKLVKSYRGKGLKETPLKFALEREQIKSPLFFPGKVLASAAADRLFISDSTNNRIVITDLAGKKVAVAGTGKTGKKDGAFSDATFWEPQGLAFDGNNTLYVADRKNHSIRALDLKAQTVKTVAGTGKHNRLVVGPRGLERVPYRYSPASTTGLNSPWGLALYNNLLYIAMSGHHQIWLMDLKSKKIGPFAGDNEEEIKDGPLPAAKFAQPSGLGMDDGKYLFVADAECSAIRALPLYGRGSVQTIVGGGLFVFGDVNGNGGAERFQVRLQHALDVAFYKDKLYVADSYNSKIKLIDPTTGSCSTFVGDTAGTLDEPGGISFSGDKLYIADTNAHRIRVVDMATKAVSTVELQGVEPTVTAESRAPKSIVK